jgi:hypothetical protein
MTAAPLVGRRFRLLAIAAVVILAPIAAWTIWDNLEARRFRQIVQDIQARGEPVSTAEYLRQYERAEGNAARYYTAAAALVFSLDIQRPPGIASTLEAGSEEAARGLAAIREWLDRHRDAEALLVRATNMEFLGGETPLRNNLDTLARLNLLADLRRRERMEAGDGDGAAQALVRQVRVARLATSERGASLLLAPAAGTAAAPTRELPRLLALEPSEASLQALAAALTEQDQDDLVARQAATFRAGLIENIWSPGRQWYVTSRFGPPLLVRPAHASTVRRDIAVLSELLEQARGPWPQRIRIEAPDRMPAQTAGSWRSMEDVLRYSFRSRARQLAASLAEFRVARVAVAVERHRRHAGVLPESLDQLAPTWLERALIDPFSGQPLVYRVTDDGFIVYSLGLNQQDDGGNLERPARSPRGAMDPPLDIGLAVTVAR